MNIGKNFLKTPFPLINAVLNKSQEGEIFSDKSTEAIIYVFHKAGFSFINSKEDSVLNEIFDLVLRTYTIPQYFHIYNPPGRFIEICNENKQYVNIKTRKRIQLKQNIGNSDFKKSELPKNYTVQKITENNFDSLQGFDLSLGNKFWRSKEDFINNGFGFFVSNEMNSPVSICYTACIADNEAEIDVATISDYQRRGLAKFAVKSFVDFCSDNNLVANWDCFEENIGSLKTATSMEFIYSKEYSFLSIFNKTKQL